MVTIIMIILIIIMIKIITILTVTIRVNSKLITTRRTIVEINVLQ